MPTFVTQILSSVDVDVDIAWPGVPFTPPNGPWLRPTVLWGEGEEWTFGSNGNGGTTIRSGILDLDFFDVASEGYANLYDLADSAIYSFSRLNTGDIRFGAARGPTTLSERGSEWVGVKVSVPFTIEETL